MVEAELMEDGGPEVVDRGGLLDGVVAKVVGGTVDGASFEAAAGEPEGKPVRIVVAAIASLREGSAAKFSGPDDDGFIEQTALFKITKERGDGLINLTGHGAVAFFDVAVLVPGVGGSSRSDSNRKAT